MKAPALLYFLFSILSSSLAQEQTPVVKSFGSDFCDSIVQVSKSFYDKHRVKLTTIDTNGLPVKLNNRTVVRFGKDSLVFLDSSPDDQYIYVSDIVGRDKKKGLVLVRVADEIMNHYYLIDQKNHTIDTFVGFPYQYKNIIIAIEDVHTDYDCQILVWHFDGKEKQLLFSDQLSRCHLMPDQFTISDHNELMFVSLDLYWIIKGSLF